MEVYVGIPEAEAPRPKGGVNNAELLFIHTNGSDLQHIPARPVIEPAIAKNQAMISKELAVAGKLVLQGKESEAITQLENVGEFASGKCREYFDDPDNGWAKNSPATIKKKGSDLPLIDTSELRKSLTWVLKDR